MTLQASPLPGMNITLVYDALPLERIARDRLRGIAQDPHAVVMDTPDVIVVLAPTKGVLLQIGDRRMRIHDQQHVAPQDTDLPAQAVQLHRLSKPSKLIAYGFNFDFLLQAADEPPAQVLTRRFLPAEEQLVALLQGPIEVFAPRIIFHRGAARYDLAFQPEENQLKAHANVHYAASALPDQQALRAALDDEHRSLLGLLAQLFPKDA